MKKGSSHRQIPRLLPLTTTTAKSSPSDTVGDHLQPEYTRCCHLRSCPTSMWSRDLVGLCYQRDLLYPQHDVIRVHVPHEHPVQRLLPAASFSVHVSIGQTGELAGLGRRRRGYGGEADVVGHLGSRRSESALLDPWERHAYYLAELCPLLGLEEGHRAEVAAVVLIDDLDFQSVVCLLDVVLFQPIIIYLFLLISPCRFGWGVSTIGWKVVVCLSWRKRSSRRVPWPCVTQERAAQK